jgi:hypothetical protein
MISEKFENIISKTPTELSQSELHEFQAYCAAHSFTLEQWLDASVSHAGPRSPFSRPIPSNATNSCPTWIRTSSQSPPTTTTSTRDQRLASTTSSQASCWPKLPGNVSNVEYSVKRGGVKTDQRGKEVSEFKREGEDDC